MMLTRKRLVWLVSLGICAALLAFGYSLLWPRYLLQQAESAIAANDLNEAETRLRRLLFRSPKNARAHFLLAQVLRQLHHPEQAEESLRKALQLGYPEKEGERELALDEAAIRFRPPLTLRKLLKETPNDLDLLEALARGYASNRDWTLAEMYFTRLIECQPNETNWYWERGQARQEAAFETGEGHGRAAADFREVVRRDSNHFEARLRLAQCLLSNAQMSEAKEELLRCRELNPKRAEPLIGLANCALEEQDWDRANELLREALELKWNSLIALAMKGDLHLLRQEPAEAVPFFQKLLVLDPMNKAAHLKLAQAYRSSGRLNEAKNQEAAFERIRSNEERQEKNQARR
ncbi:MAG TPA: tetratricopeptide repeat protein [Gemmataceae bacterium]|nr:tetratricopeptide repeat protein [Gemmataceae bacterium]